MSILLVLLAVATFGLWSFIGSSLWGSRLAVPAVFAFLSLGVVTTMAITPFFLIGTGWVIVAELGLAVALGATLLVRSPSLRRRPSVGSLALWMPASIGAALWLATRVAAEFVPGASAVSWAMEGDATNNLNYARRIVADNGILVGATENPVPLPVSAVALPLSLERLPASFGEALATELATYGWVWIGALAVSCVVMGVVAASLIDPGKRRLVAITSGLGSLLPLTWFVGGLPIDFGYFNMPFTIILALTSWLIYLASPRSPLVALVAQVCVATLLLLTWTPIALLAVTLGVGLAVRERHTILAARGWRLGVVIAVVGIGAGWAATLIAPTYFAQSGALAASGQGFPPPWLLALPLVGVVLLAAAALRGRIATPFFGGVIALVVSSYASVALFLVLSGAAFNPWTAYYPVKVAWLACVILLPIALSLLAALASLATNRIISSATVALVGTAVVSLAAFAPVTPARGFPAYQPAERILAGHVWHTGDDAVSVIVAVTNASAGTDETPILWGSTSSDEQMVNFWTIYSIGDQDPGDRELRRFAFREYGAFRGDGERGPSSFNVLCELIRDPERSIVIYTDDAASKNDFVENCTDSFARFVVGDTPGLD